MRGDEYFPKDEKEDVIEQIIKMLSQEEEPTQDYYQPQMYDIPQQQQQGSDMNIGMLKGIKNNLMGGESAESGMSLGNNPLYSSEAGLSGMGIGAIIAAAIAAQHGLSNATDTVYEGQKTDDAFSGNFGTEPWLAWAHDKLGMGPTMGEKFDAAINNKDYGKAFSRSFGMADYWSDPARTWGYDIAKKSLGDNVAAFLSPLNYMFEKW